MVPFFWGGAAQTPWTFEDLIKTTDLPQINPEMESLTQLQVVSGSLKAI